MTARESLGGHRSHRSYKEQRGRCGSCARQLSPFKVRTGWGGQTSSFPLQLSAPPPDYSSDSQRIQNAVTNARHGPCHWHPAATALAPRASFRPTHGPGPVPSKPPDGKWFRCVNDKIIRYHVSQWLCGIRGFSALAEVFVRSALAQLILNCLSSAGGGGGGGGGCPHNDGLSSV